MDDLEFIFDGFSQSDFNRVSESASHIDMVNRIGRCIETQLQYRYEHIGGYIHRQEVQLGEGQLRSVQPAECPVRDRLQAGAKLTDRRER